ncbi:type IV secretory system conjugative DNA transfer family protein [Streptomyces cucumeris]|uniref:type IV secretory system conjugative DNA transfer family protein n=1 Tax=Streptomyces cucumeris TaxID=2962890 RepID=UPI003D74B46B
MTAGLNRGGPAEHGRPPGPEHGIPDGLLIGIMAFLLGLTCLVWSATGLAGLFAHGAWPDGLAFMRTPLALRHLVEEPHNLAAAWPDTPKAQLSGYGLFWGLFISELMVLIVLTVFAVGTLTRYRAVRARRRAEAIQAAAEAQADTDAKRRGTVNGAAGPTSSVQAPGGTYPAAASGIEAAGYGAPRAEATPPPVATASAPTVPGPSGPPPAGVAPTVAPADTAPGSATSAPATAPPTAAAPHAPADPVSATLPGGELTRSHVLYGAQRGTSAAEAVLEAAGPVLVVTSDAALWSATKDARSRFGPTHVFDPSHLLDTPARLRWNPASDCGSRDIAAARAAALLAPVRPAHAMDKPMAEAAETLLRCWLHAAAVDGRPFRQVHRWAQGNSAHEPVRILRTNPKAAGGTAGELEATLTAHPERRDLAQELTARALGALSSIHIRDACNPGRADSLALESFVGEGGTLYVMGESIEDPRTHPGAMPLLTALASHVVEHGRRMAERSSSGRLDPPLTLVLDDVAAVAPLPALPDLLAQGAAQGMPTLALMRSQEQARARWPHRTLAAQDQG